VSNANNDEQFDANSPQRKEDILRGRDIIPGSTPYGNKAGQEENLQETTQNAPHPPAEAETSPENQNRHVSIPEARPEQIETPDDIPLEPANTEQRRSEIPRFNLAEKIMAEQRRITAVRRKGPGQTEEAQKQVQEVESVSDTKEPMSAELSEQEQIIVEIVARDVEKLCRGDTLRLRNW